MNSPKSLGFTLLEIVVAVSIMVLLAGVAVPVTAAMVRSAKSEATSKRLEVIAGGVEAYFRDTLRFPGDLDSLGADDGVAGWKGPYLHDNFVASTNGSGSYVEDDFGTAILVADPTPTTLDLVSAGSDRVVDSADDLVRRVNVLPILRAVTQQRIDIFNAGILAYNRNRSASSSGLPADVGDAFSQLVSEGYLPNDSGYRFDAWGAELIPDPPSQAPMVAVSSSNMSTVMAGDTDPNSAGGSGSNNGTGWGWGGDGNSGNNGGGNGNNGNGNGNGGGNGNSGNGNGNGGGNGNNGNGNGNGGGNGNSGNGNGNGGNGGGGGGGGGKGKKGN